MSVAQKGGKLVVVNLQKTDADQLAEQTGLRIGCKIDDVMVALMRCLELEIPPFVLTRWLARLNERSNLSLVSVCELI